MCASVSVSVCVMSENRRQRGDALVRRAQQHQQHQQHQDPAQSARSSHNTAHSEDDDVELVDEFLQLSGQGSVVEEEQEASTRQQRPPSGVQLQQDQDQTSDPVIDTIMSQLKYLSSPFAEMRTYGISQLLFHFQTQDVNVPELLTRDTFLRQLLQWFNFEHITHYKIGLEILQHIIAVSTT